MNDVVRAHLWISGRVQGVCYRADCRDAAARIGVAGWVRNLPDSRVEVVAEGEKERVDAMVTWCHRGPPVAVVGDVKVEWETPRNEKGFRIGY